MFNARYLSSAFILFHVVLGAVLLYGSVHTVVHLGPSDPHALVIGGVEALAAVAFLIPRTMRAGAGVLLVVIAFAFIMHAVRGEVRPDLVVFAAGVLLVAVHGNARATGEAPAQPA